MSINFGHPKLYQQGDAMLAGRNKVYREFHVSDKNSTIYK